MFRIGKQIGAGDGPGNALQMKAAIRPGEQLDVDLIGRGGRAPVPAGDELRLALLVLRRGAETAFLGSEESGLCSVDRCAVDREPPAYLVKTLDLGWRDDTLGVGSNVEKIVPSLAGDVDGGT